MTQLWGDCPHEIAVQAATRVTVLLGAIVLDSLVGRAGVNGFELRPEHAESPL